MGTVWNCTRALAAMWLLTALTGTATAHTWPEFTVRLAPNGTMVGKRSTNRAPAPDEESTYLVPPAPERQVLPTHKLVRAAQGPLTEASYSSESPMLSVAPGDFVAIQYRENGHVSKADVDTPKPVNRGTVYIYGTTENDLSNFNLMDVHLKWTEDGRGGDGKGRLLATRNYDDGQCHEASPATDIEGIIGYRKEHVTQLDSLLCQNDIQIPEDAPVGQVYTVIWVWDWPTMSAMGVDVSPASYELDVGDPHVVVSEIYTGVLDYNVVDPCDESLGALKGPACAQGNSRVATPFVVDQPAELRGIATQMAEPFLVKVPQAGFDVSSATADPSYIPFAVLIGQTALSEFPLPSSILQAQNTAGAAGGGAAAPAPTPDSSAPPEADDEVIVTETATVPESMETMTVTRTPATPVPRPRAARLRRRAIIDW